MIEIQLDRKFTLTIKEAAAYFNIGEKKLRRIVETADEMGVTPAFAVYSGNRYLIIRHLFEQYLIETKEI